MPTAVEPQLVRPEQTRALYRLSDPALSELGLEEFLDELLVRVQDALRVDTVAILLLDAESNELIARAAKGIEEEVEQGVRIPVGRGFAGRIAAERVAIFIEDVNHADVLNPILREKGISSLLGVPLIVDGKLIGVLHVGSLTTRIFDERDLAVLQVAAARAAPGIESARLYSQLAREHRVAVALQRSLLPKTLVQSPGIRTAARYLAASAEVGGDWYDVFELTGGRLGVTIGDVVGHGIQAAALMGQLRTALHAYATEGRSPAQTLELVDRFVQSLPGSPMATAAYAVLDPEPGTLCIASAGHLPPVIVGAGGSRLLELGSSPPLGAFPYGRFEEKEVPLQVGESLVLYTDGLVERPGVPLQESIGELSAVIGSADTAEEVCQLAFEKLVPPSGIRDDIAMVVVQHAGLAEQLDLRLPADPRVLVQLRRVLRRWLRERGAPEEAITEVTIAVNEACANSIEHAYSPRPAEFSVRGEVSRNGNGDEVRIVVADEGRWRPRRGENRGRGLQIMDAAMDAVQVRATEEGTEIEMRRRLAA